MNALDRYLSPTLAKELFSANWAAYPVRYDVFCATFSHGFFKEIANRLNDDQTKERALTGHSSNELGTRNTLASVSESVRLYIQVAEPIAKKLCRSIKHLDPNDIVQEGFVKLAKEDVRATCRDQFVALVQKTLRNLMIDEMRRAGAQKRSAELQAIDSGTIDYKASTPSQQLQIREQESELRRAIGCLSTQARALLTRRYWNDVPLLKLAQEQNVKKDRVYRRVNRALKTIRFAFSNRF